MRFISALLCLCLTFNVMAASGTVQEFERALDEYQYSLTVEWDQKDQKFMTVRTEAFYEALSDLMNQGLTSQDILKVVSTKSKNAKEVEALKARMEILAKNATSSSELAQAITASSKGLYSTGASWEGTSILISVGIVAVIGAVVAYSIWFNNNKVCVEHAVGQECGWVSPYNYMNNPTAPQFPHYPQRYECWAASYCTRYEDK